MNGKNILKNGIPKKFIGVPKIMFFSTAQKQNTIAIGIVVREAEEVNRRGDTKNLGSNGKQTAIVRASYGKRSSPRTLRNPKFLAGYTYICIFLVLFFLPYAAGSFNFSIQQRGLRRLILFSSTYRIEEREK